MSVNCLISDMTDRIFFTKTRPTKMKCGQLDSGEGSQATALGDLEEGLCPIGLDADGGSESWEHGRTALRMSQIKLRDVCAASHRLSWSCGGWQRQTALLKKM